MPREHATIKMSSEEVASFLATQRYCILGTLDESGGPWADAVSCILDEEKLVFRVPADTRSAANIERDQRVCCVFEEHPPDTGYYTIKGAIVHGRAGHLDGVSRERVSLALDDHDDPVDGGVRSAVVLYAISLDDVASFDFGKIKRRFEQGTT